jgi:hypothetical protein
MREELPAVKLTGMGVRKVRSKSERPADGDMRAVQDLTPANANKETPG